MQTAADAAALAGVQELLRLNNTASAEDKARSYVDPNVAGATEVEVTFPASDKIQVIVRDPHAPLHFASVLKIDSEPVAAMAQARISSPVAYSKGLTPIGILPLGGSESASDAYGYGWGQNATIKEGGGSGTTGNYGWIDLGQGGGTSGLRDMLVNGGGAAALNQLVPTVPGNKVPGGGALNDWIDWNGVADNHTFAQVCPPPDANGVVHVNTDLAGDSPDGCHRLVTMPVVINPNGNGAARYEFPNGKKDMKVIGFAQFFITYTGGTGNDAVVQGKFVRTVSIEDAQYGTVGSSGQVHYALVK